MTAGKGPRPNQAELMFAIAAALRCTCGMCISIKGLSSAVAPACMAWPSKNSRAAYVKTAVSMCAMEW